VTGSALPLPAVAPPMPPDLALMGTLPDALLAWLAQGRWLDAVLLGVLLEAGALGLWHHRTGRGLRSAAWLPNLAAGLCLMLALRAALVGAHPVWSAAALAAAGLAHLADLRQRLRGLQPTFTAPQPMAAARPTAPRPGRRRPALSAAPPPPGRSPARCRSARPACR